MSYEVVSQAAAVAAPAAPIHQISISDESPSTLLARLIVIFDLHTLAGFHLTFAKVS